MIVGNTVQEIFGRLPDEKDLEQSTPAEKGLTNLHIHLPPNFGSIAGVEDAVGKAQEEEIVVLGTCNYYDHSIYRPFAKAAIQSGIVPVFGIEVLTMDEPLREKGTLVNDPKNPGKFYLCGKGLTTFDAISEEVRPIWETIRQGDRQRIEAMIAKLNDIDALKKNNIRLEYAEIAQKIAEEKQVPVETVFLQERHLVQALQAAVFERTSPAERQEFLQRVYQIDGDVETQNVVKIQNDLRTHLLKQGKAAYVEESYISPDEAATLIVGLGGYVSYPTLIDGAPSISPFEGPPQAFIENLLERGIGATEFIPTRNDLETLRTHAIALREQGFVVGAGTEHNDAVWIPLLPACRQATPLTGDLLEIFWEGACVAVAHQYLRAKGKTGFQFFAEQKERLAQLDTLRDLGTRVIEALRN